MNSAITFYRSSLGKKYIMAGTGILLFIFVAGHLVGNLQVFLAPEIINNYAHFLQSEPVLLWTARLGLIACVVLHIMAAIQLTAMNKAARPVPYATDTAYKATFRSRHMLMSGLIVLAFIVYHIAHFTVLIPGINGVGDFRHLEFALPSGVRVHDVYAMMILGFQVWWVVLFYLVAQGLLFMHLSHGLSSMFQSLGWRSHAWWTRIQRFAQVTSIAIFVGYAIIPIAIYMRIVGADYAEKKRFEVKSAELHASALTQDGKEVAH